MERHKRFDLVWSEPINRFGSVRHLVCQLLHFISNEKKKKEEEEPRRCVWTKIKKYIYSNGQYPKWKDGIFQNRWEEGRKAWKLLFFLFIWICQLKEDDVTKSPQSEGQVPVFLHFSCPFHFHLKPSIINTVFSSLSSWLLYLTLSSPSIIIL